MPITPDDFYRETQAADRALSPQGPQPLRDHAALRRGLHGRDDGALPAAQAGASRLLDQHPHLGEPDRDAHVAAAVPRLPRLHRGPREARAARAEVHRAATASGSRTTSSAASRRRARRSRSARSRTSSSAAACSASAAPPTPSTAVRLSLGCDIGGGNAFSLIRVLEEAYKVGMCNNTMLDGSVNPREQDLAEAERNKLCPYRAFYLATLGGARRPLPRRPARQLREGQGGRLRRARLERRPAGHARGTSRSSPSGAARDDRAGRRRCCSASWRSATTATSTRPGSPASVSTSRAEANGRDERISGSGGPGGRPRHPAPHCRRRLCRVRAVERRGRRGAEGVARLPQSGGRAAQPPAHVDWVTILRFASPAAARAWLQSDVRARLIADVQRFFVGSEDVHILPDTGVQRDSAVSAVISFKVPGLNSGMRCLKWQQRIQAAEAEFRGFLRHKIERPTPGPAPTSGSSSCRSTAMPTSTHGWIRPCGRRCLRKARASTPA